VPRIAIEVDDREKVRCFVRFVSCPYEQGITMILVKVKPQRMILCVLML
jgi:hypothetical protein